MGESNRDIVALLYESFRRRDHAAAFTRLSEEIEWNMEDVGMPGLNQVYRGHDGVRAFWREWLGAWSEIDWQVAGIEELPDGRVRVEVRQRNKGRDSGMWIDQPPFAQIWSLRDGKVTRMDAEWVER